MIKITGVIEIIGIDETTNKAVDFMKYLQKHYVHYVISECDSPGLSNMSITVDYDNMVPIIWYILHHYRKDDFIKIIIC